MNSSHARKQSVHTSKAMVVLPSSVDDFLADCASPVATETHAAMPSPKVHAAPAKSAETDSDATFEDVPEHLF